MYCNKKSFKKKQTTVAEIEIYLHLIKSFFLLKPEFLYLLLNKICVTVISQHITANNCTIDLCLFSDLLFIIFLSFFNGLKFQMDIKLKGKLESSSGLCQHSKCCSWSFSSQLKTIRSNWIGS